MPAERLPNSQSDRAFPSPPDCQCTCQCACPAARLTQSKKLQGGEAAPGTAAAFPFSPPPPHSATPGLAHQFRTASVKAVRVQTWGWGGVAKAAPFSVTQRECHCRDHCNANGWQGCTTKGNTQTATLLSHLYELQSQYVNCNCSLKVFYFSCFHYRVWKFSKKPNEKVIALMQANAQCPSPHRDTCPVWCTKNHSANELILIVLISQQPQWACILGDKMCFWSLVLIPEIKGNKRLPQRQISQVILWPKKHFL